MPRVSIVLPNYNYARYLKERIRSILHQTYTDFELLYVDDASSDESNRIAESFSSDSRVKLFCYKDNSGGAFERRKDTIAMSSGEWIWFAEADDSAHPRFLERMLGHIDANPGVGIAHARMVTMDPAGRILGINWPSFGDLARRLDSDYFATGPDDAIWLTAQCFYSSSSGILLKREALIACGGYDTRLRSASDWDLYLRMLQSCGVVYTAEPLAYYRSHVQSVTRQTSDAVRLLEDAYVVAAGYSWICRDPRVSVADKRIVKQRMLARIFDLFTAGHIVAPARLRFAAEAIHNILPDRRFAGIQWS